MFFIIVRCFQYESIKHFLKEIIFFVTVYPYFFLFFLFSISTNHTYFKLIQFAYCKRNIITAEYIVNHKVFLMTIVPSIWSIFIM